MKTFSEFVNEKKMTIKAANNILLGAYNDSHPGAHPADAIAELKGLINSYTYAELVVFIERMLGKTKNEKMIKFYNALLTPECEEAFTRLAG